jgi:hypothetical protein
MDLKLRTPELCLMQSLVRTMKDSGYIPSSIRLKDIISAGFELVRSANVANCCNDEVGLETRYPVGIITNWTGDVKFRNFTFDKVTATYLDDLIHRSGLTEPITIWAQRNGMVSDLALIPTFLVTGSFFHYLLNQFHMDRAFNISARDASKIMDELLIDDDVFHVDISLKLYSSFMDDLKFDYIHDFYQLVDEDLIDHLLASHNAFGFRGSDEMNVSVFIRRTGGRMTCSCKPTLIRARDIENYLDR